MTLLVQRHLLYTQQHCIVLKASSFSSSGQSIFCFCNSVLEVADMSLLDALRYRLLPPLMVVVFTAATQALVSLGNPHRWGD